VSGQDSVVGLNHGRGDTGSRVDGELELGLLAVVGGQALEQESAEARAGAAAERVEDQEALEGVAVVCLRQLTSHVFMQHTGNTTDAINDIVNKLLANGVVATGI